MNEFEISIERSVTKNPSVKPFWLALSNNFHGLGQINPSSYNKGEIRIVDMGLIGLNLL